MRRTIAGPVFEDASNPDGGVELNILDDPEPAFSGAYSVTVWKPPVTVTHTVGIYALGHAPWVDEFDPLSGVILHEQFELMPVAAD